MRLRGYDGIRTLRLGLVVGLFAGCGGGSSATPDSGDSGSGTFQLAWEDNFDAFDSTRWALQTHTWDGNLAQFSIANTTFANGIASLLLTPEPTDTAKPFRGVEMRSRDTLTYGKVESRIRFAKGSGVVSSLVLIYTPWPADDWNELDIETLGRYTDRTQLNVMIYTGPPTTPPVTQAVTPTQFPQLTALPFDPSADFHDYAIEWTPAEARFVVDGVVKRTWSDQIDRLKLPQNILLTIWASSAADWAGAIQPDSAPTSADYDWIRVYDWVPAGTSP
jgi:endo-1,3-1,4-beta-glycanase ExoK